MPFFPGNVSLQQWFEYCKNGKKKNCPVCKQSCSNANVGRLYFQSVGDQNDVSLSQKPDLDEETPEELRGEVKRLEGKVSGLNSVLEEKQKNLETVCSQVHVFLFTFWYFGCLKVVSDHILMSYFQLTIMSSQKIHFCLVLPIFGTKNYQPAVILYMFSLYNCVLLSFSI